LRWSSEWVVRLGDGTDESHQKMLTAIENLWPYTGELFIPQHIETFDEIGFDIASLKQPWTENVMIVLEEATLTVPCLWR
jgi:ring-1,2-phenylacetyl-CoA epoxidase subunit PaaC